MGTMQFISIFLILIIACGALPVPARQEPTNDAEFQKAIDKAENMHLSKNYVGEIKELEKAAKIKDGNCAECYHRIAQAYVSQHKFNDAVVAFKRAIELDPAGEPDVLVELGAAQYFLNDAKNLTEAEKSFRRAIELNTSNIEIAYYYLGNILVKLGQEQEGESALNECCRIRPKSRWASAARARFAGQSFSNEPLAMDFKVTSITGEEVSLEKYRGKIILLDFWATWCGPCRAELPNIKEIWKKHESDQFVIIGVSQDTDQRKFKDYITKEHLTWPQYFDKLGWENKIAQLYQINAIPSAIVIDPTGAVHSVGLRGGKLAAEIDELLKKLPPTLKADH